MKFDDEPIPFTRFCKPRNQITYDIFDQPSEPGYQRFKTSFQSFFSKDTSTPITNDSNQGIVAERTKWIHTMQSR